MDMLWTFLMWHALAKLHAHTETTVTILEHVTVDLGNSVRSFARKCRKVDTRELPSEEAARGRRKSKLLSKKQLKAQEVADGTKTGRKQTSKRKILNHETFKLHNLPHYPGWIRRMGTTDNYSTQLVSSHLFRRNGTNVHIRNLGRKRAQTHQGLVRPHQQAPA